MLDSTILDITLGMLLFFLVLSLICSAVQEWVASAVGLRSRNLRDGIDNLLGAEVARSFYAHGLLKSLYRRPGRLGFLKEMGGGRGVGPSYIAPRLFAQVLVDVIDRGESVGGTRENAVAKTFQEVEAAVRRLPQPSVREALLSLLADAKGDVDAFRARAADWFDAAMERVSGWYARIVKLSLFVIAGGLVVLFNADAIEVGKTLWQDRALRASLAVLAEETAERHVESGEEGTESLVSPAEARAYLERFPIGWKCKESDGLCFWQNLRGGQALIGWLVSIAACSFGAPFWFGLLRRVASLRGSGRRPDRSAQGPPAG